MSFELHPVGVSRCPRPADSGSWACRLDDRCPVVGV